MSAAENKTSNASSQSQSADLAKLCRRATITGQPGMEGDIMLPGAFAGKSIAVLTSGGDAQGMNSALRAVVRMSIYSGCKVYFIHEGYQGMVDGGANIKEATWNDVSGIIQLGGTVIGSARCSDFRELEGRLKAASNLIKLDITNLVVIGGDGSLTGADTFRQEWPKLIEQLLSEKRISQEQFDRCQRLNIVGMVGSIDNDFCGTDMTIGTDSALNRILEATDAITTTAHSHQRCFVMEVMGRHCGYLALVASLACEADWVFIPENPPKENWQDRLCNRLTNNRLLGQRVNIIIVSEGAIDSQCQPITAEQLRQLISSRLGFDTRITVLGHVQRGGAPSSFDRILGIRMGAEAVCALIHASMNPDLPACVISLDGNNIRRVPLMECVEKTREIAKVMSQKDFLAAQTLRGKSFNNNLNVYLTLSKLHALPANLVEKNTEELPVIGMVNIGAPACGTNAAMRSFVRISINNCYRVLAVHEGLRGLIEDRVISLKWNDVHGWTNIGGSKIGSRRTKPSELGLEILAEKFRQYKFKAFLIIGGFEGFLALDQLYQGRSKHPEFRIPLILIPASISNNIPGTQFSLGADTAINEITQTIDKLKQSALGTTRRVFVVETMGAKCGYLATMAGLAGGADAAYIFEETLMLDDLLSDVKHLRSKMDSITRGLVLVSDGANSNYNSDFIHRLYSEESKGVFDCRLNVLGHVQQGGVPSPFDRNCGTKMGVKAAERIHAEIQATLGGAGGAGATNVLAAVLGTVGKQSLFTPVDILLPDTDLKNRKPMVEWWLRLRSLMRIMAHHQTVYHEEAT